MKWTCSYCSRPQVATNQNWGVSEGQVFVSEKADSFWCRTFAVKCLNESCGKTTLSYKIYTLGINPGGIRCAGDLIETWHLWPPSSSRPQPNYIPAPITEDYEEACLIRDLSPKASAALARRCLQGMIRDFCGISRGTLDKEIKELRRQLDAGEAPRDITPESVDGIDHVRSVGNIGAHMERDIDLIIETEPEEAQILIGLIETLFEE